MPLLLLPPETLSHVFGEIGTSFFREDLGRLTVCKTWFEFALPVLFKNVKLTRHTLKSLISSRVMENSAQIQRNLETLDLEFCELGATPPGENPHTWIDNLNSDVAEFATRVRQSRRLHTLRIQALGRSASIANYINFSIGANLSLPVVLDLLSLGNLDTLLLDLNAGLLKPEGEERETLHLCPAISALLPTLRTLHVRMQYICPDVLKPLGTDYRLCLSTVVINTSLNYKRSEITSSFHSRSFEILSLDVLTGATMILDEDSPWDADGKLLEEDPEPESELSDGGFSDL
ncbi:hypothetical protein F5Y03DRAFT_399249 [Xylaria venustula]|nr:hypothetical protein F5Y03DRAFT_399249 [Xylaria venustula]